MTHLDQTHVPISLTRVSISMVTIALYDTLGPDTCAYTINQIEYLYGYYSIV